MARDVIEVTITAGRRPDLLERTLDSFHDQVLRHFRVTRLIVNIDPVFGDESDLARCREIVSARCGDVLLNTPQRPSFGAAVKWAWSQTTAERVLHLEDDWIVRHPITPETVETCFKLSSKVRNVVLSCPTLGSAGKKFKGTESYKKMPDGTVKKKHLPVFGTSPRFMDGGFARACAALMNPDYDPEKQMRPKLKVNPQLWRVQKPWRCAILWGPEGDVVIDDIGREWRDARGIEKIVEGGKSVWRVNKTEPAEIAHPDPWFLAKQAFADKKKDASPLHALNRMARIHAAHVGHTEPEWIDETTCFASVESWALESFSKVFRVYPNMTPRRQGGYLVVVMSRDHPLLVDGTNRLNLAETTRTPAELPVIVIRRKSADHRQ